MDEAPPRGRVPGEKVTVGGAVNIREKVHNDGRKSKWRVETSHDLIIGKNLVLYCIVEKNAVLDCSWKKHCL